MIRRLLLAPLVAVPIAAVAWCPYVWPVVTTFARCFTRDLTHREADPLG